jgi:hypothetical protein
MSKYLKGKMRLVYLDQCVVSRLIQKPENEPWKELRDTIFLCHEKQRILCPSSLEHLVETSAMTERDAIDADRIVRVLSFGWSLALEPKLVARQIFCTLTGMKMSRGQFLQKGMLQPLSRPGTLNTLRKLKEEMDPHNAWLMQGVNELNAITRDGKRFGPEALKFLIQQTTGSSAKQLAAAVSKAICTGRAEVFPSKHRETCRDWPSTIVYTLVKEHRFRSSLLMNLKTKLAQENVSFIPTLRIKCELQAFQFAQREKIDPGDQYDITRIGCALPYADILVTDGGKAHALRELGLDDEFGVEVFSMKRRELPALIARLEAISAN